MQNKKERNDTSLYKTFTYHHGNDDDVVDVDVDVDDKC